MPCHISIKQALTALACTVLKPVISSVNIVLRATMVGYRCHNYALTEHISHSAVLAVSRGLQEAVILI